MGKGTIIGIITFLVLVTTFILNVQDINWKIPLPTEEPFKISFTPAYFTLGEHEQTPVTLTISDFDTSKLKTLTLLESNIIIDRPDKIIGIEVAKSIRWETGTFNNNYVFNYQKNNYINNNKFEAKGILYGCKNCFTDKDYPYQITLTIQYELENESIKPFVKSIDIPIK